MIGRSVDLGGGVARRAAAGAAGSPTRDLDGD